MDYIAHPTAIIDAGAQIGAGSRIWHWVHVSACARIGRDCSLGQNVFIGAGALITRDILPYALMTGVAARQIGWMSAHGERLQLPLTGSGKAVCGASGQAYRLDNGRLERQ